MARSSADPDRAWDVKGISISDEVRVNSSGFLRVSGARWYESMLSELMWIWFAAPALDLDEAALSVDPCRPREVRRRPFHEFSALATMDGAPARLKALGVDGMQKTRNAHVISAVIHKMTDDT